jgi:recombinational DNA repair protein (RecF pathway)
MSQYFSDRAIILSRRDLGEADRLVKVFFLERGRETVVARSVRKPRAKLRGLLEPSTEVELQCVVAKSLPVVTGGKMIAAHAALSSRYEVLIASQAIAEITERTIAEHNAEPGWYHFYAAALNALEANPNAADIRGLIWVAALAKNLNYLGLSPVFRTGQTHFRIRDGVFSASGDIMLSSAAVKLWRAARDFSVDDLLKIKNAETAIVELEPTLLAFWLHQTGVEKLRTRSLEGFVDLKNLI